MKLAFKHRNNFDQREKEHFDKLTTAHKEYVTKIKDLVKVEIKAAKDNVTYAKKLNKKLKEKFNKFNIETSPFKKAILASQLMLLRSELVVDTGGGILESLEGMIEVSSIGRLIEKKIRKQKSDCIDLESKNKTCYCCREKTSLSKRQQRETMQGIPKNAERCIHHS